jgi:hypothetical protein
LETARLLKMIPLLSKNRSMASWIQVCGAAGNDKAVANARLWLNARLCLYRAYNTCSSCTPTIPSQCGILSHTHRMKVVTLPMRSD